MPGSGGGMRSVMILRGVSRAADELTPVPDTSGLASMTQAVEFIVDLPERKPRDLGGQILSVLTARKLCNCKLVYLKRHPSAL